MAFYQCSFCKNSFRSDEERKNMKEFALKIVKQSENALRQENVNRDRSNNKLIFSYGTIWTNTAGAGDGARI